MPVNVVNVLDSFGTVTSGISCLLNFLLFFLNMPSTVLLPVYICGGGCLFTISLSAWRAGMGYFLFMYREDMTVLIICAIGRMAPLFCGSG